MAIHSTNWHICLLSLALAFAATSNTASAFSSKSRRVSNKRGPSSFASTRRVFCFTFAGGAHTMFSGIRTSNKPPRSSPSTQLKYRAIDDDGALAYCDMTDSSSYTDSLWQAALSEGLQQEQDSSKTSKQKTSKDGLMETAKAFIPVAVEFGIVAATAANVHYLN